DHSGRTAQRADPRGHNRDDAAHQPSDVRQRSGSEYAGDLLLPILTAAADSFFALTPERVLEAVETLGRRATGYALALNSRQNRVYEVELEAGEETERLVAKFYRPGRWSREAITCEHEFLRELAEEDVPVVPPLDLGGTTLGVSGGLHYALFPRVRGRVPEEL